MKINFKFRQKTIYIFIFMLYTVLLVFLTLTVNRYINEQNRLKDCLAQRSTVSSWESWEPISSYYEGTGEKTLLFQSGGKVTLSDEKGSFVVEDNVSGQIRQYNQGVLFVILVKSYADKTYRYKDYTIHSLKECEELANLLVQGDYNTIREKGGTVWQTNSGTYLVD